MSTLAEPSAKREVVYPDSDGQPMSDNTVQFRWIVTLQGNLDALFRDDPNVFVAGDLLWYPVEGDNRTRCAPDTMVVVGRPKGDRGSYQQWKEDDIAPQVVFEVLSPGNRASGLVRKFRFYEQYGVEEYYVYDPDSNDLAVWIRRGPQLEEITDANNWVSPRLGIRFELLDGELRIYRPDGKPFETYLELFEERDKAERDAKAAEQQAKTAKREANAAKREAEAASRRAEQLAAQLRSLGVEPENEA